MKKNNDNSSVVIKEITFNDGNKWKFNKDDIVLLVGPNNVGKSRTLKDLREDLNDTSKIKVLVKEIDLFNQINKFLKENNIFILECGEIERFVPEVSGHGNTWVEKVFTNYADISTDVYDEARKFIRTVFIQ